MFGCYDYETRKIYYIGYIISVFAKNGVFCLSCRFWQQNSLLNPLVPLTIKPSHNTLYRCSCAFVGQKMHSLISRLGIINLGNSSCRSVTTTCFSKLVMSLALLSRKVNHLPDSIING